MQKVDSLLHLIIVSFFNDVLLVKSDMQKAKDVVILSQLRNIIFNYIYIFYIEFKNNRHTHCSRNNVVMLYTHVYMSVYDYIYTHP